MLILHKHNEKKDNVQMCKCANVQMCKCADVQITDYRYSFRACLSLDSALYIWTLTVFSEI